MNYENIDALSEKEILQLYNEVLEGGIELSDDIWCECTGGLISGGYGWNSYTGTTTWNGGSCNNEYVLHPCRECGLGGRSYNNYISIYCHYR